MKWQRIYHIEATGKSGEAHYIDFPLTCRFKVNDACLPYAMESTFQIYNLSPETRHDLQKDYFEMAEYRPFIFAAGYEYELPIPIVFQGGIMLAHSYRRGPDWITELTVRDGAFAQQTSQIQLSIPSTAQNPYIFRNVLEQLALSMQDQHVTLGVIGNFIMPSTQRGIVFCGNTWDLLTNMILPMQGQISINQEEINIVQLNEVIEAQGVVTTIDADHGLLDSPRHQQNKLICRMIFEPRFQMYQQVTVNSVEPGNSGVWKVLQVDHSGTISGAVCEALNTEVTLFQGDSEFIPVS